MSGEENSKNGNEIQIDLGRIFSLLLKRWWTILICLIVGAGMGFGIAKITYKPTYQSTATYLLTYNSGGTTVSSMTQDISFIKTIMGSCVTIVQQPTFMRELEEKVNSSEDSQGSLDYITAGQLSSYIAYSYNATNASITVSVTTEDADKSYRIISSLIEDNYMPDYIKEVYKLGETDSLLFSLINVPVTPSAPVYNASTTKYAIVGGIGLVFLCVIVWAIVAIVDTRIKSEEDLTNRYNIPVLGTIPDLEDRGLKIMGGSKD